jgi:NADH:ubiquinone oxidoreductase subunit C
VSDEELSQIAVACSGELKRGKKFVTISVERNMVSEACRRVTALPGFYHLSTVSGVDLGKEVEIIYHFWKGREFVAVETRAPKSDPHVPSLSSQLPSSTLYEAEVKDLLGVQFDGNPLMAGKLLLPDTYPAGAPPPLTKEADPEKIRRMMELE